MHNENGGDRLLIYSDEGALAHGAAGLVSAMGSFEVILADPDLCHLIPAAERLSPDFILLGLTSVMTLGFIARLRQCSPASRIILWDRLFSEELTDKAREMGNIFLLRRGCSNQEFRDNFSRIVSGLEPIEPDAPQGCTRIDLTEREAQLVGLLVQGLRNKEIAVCLGISEGTVRIYLSKLFVKVGARDRFELAVFGMKNMMLGHAFWDGHNAFVTDGDEQRARPVLRSLLLIEPKRKKGYVEIGDKSRAARALA